MMSPTIVTPAKILSFFIIFLLKNPALSGGVSAGGDAGESGDQSSNPISSGGGNISGATHDAGGFGLRRAGLCNIHELPDLDEPSDEYGSG